MSAFSSLTHLECSKTGERLPAGGLMNLSPAGAPLLARYDLEAAARTLRPEALRERRSDMWRYHEVLPAPAPGAIVSLGEGMTPLLAAPRLGARLGLSRLYIKDEGTNPTGSFKARGMSVAITMARLLGAEKVVVPTAGNAGGAAAAYASRAGIEAHIFVPADAPPVHKAECALAGAFVTEVRGTIYHCGAIAARMGPSRGWFDLSTFREPYRAEGKKTMTFELFEQLNGELPDAIVYPTGGGTGLVAMWKAFGEMEALGWIGSARPRMISVQAEGCAPLVKAFEAGRPNAELWENPTTKVSGLRAPKVLADSLCLAAIRESGGAAAAVPDEAMFEAQREAGGAGGFLLCPEGAACIAALRVLKERGAVGADERIVVFNTATALKYADMISAECPVVDPLPEEKAG
ncbi:MAG TPA: threonine synthase [Nitrospinae bacterium]|nr:threonine synthase [Nitrospinota bacterium]